VTSASQGTKSDAQALLRAAQIASSARRDPPIAALGTKRAPLGMMIEPLSLPRASQIAAI
jgi:hypothetical protein